MINKIMFLRFLYIKTSIFWKYLWKLYCKKIDKKYQHIVYFVCKDVICTWDTYKTYGKVNFNMRRCRKRLHKLKNVNLISKTNNRAEDRNCSIILICQHFWGKNRAKCKKTLHCQNELINKQNRIILKGCFFTLYCCWWW